MAKSVYPGFAALNRRRIELIEKKYKKGPGLSKDETREFEMLQKVTGEMLDYRFPLDFSQFDKVERLMKRIEASRKKGRKS
jgi:hypothetical protein